MCVILLQRTGLRAAQAPQGKARAPLGLARAALL